MPHRIAERLRIFRERKGWTKGELARQLGYKTVATVSHWETGKRVPSIDNLRRIARLLECTVEELDPEDEAYKPDHRGDRGKPLQQSHANTDTPGGAAKSPPREAGVSMDSGGLLNIPDADEFRKILGVYLTLDTPAERAEFVKHARAFVPGSSAKAKNNRR